MTPAEALEQVRALAETWRFKGKGAPDDMPDQFDEYADELAHEILAILDVVTPDAPATVEGTSDSPSHAWVAGRCPACGRRGLFVGSGGYLSCSQSGCPDPGAPHDALIPATPERTEQEREAVDRAAQGVVATLAMATSLGVDSIDAREVANMILMLAETDPPPSRSGRRLWSG